MEDREKPTVRPPPCDIAMQADEVDRRACDLREQAAHMLNHAEVLSRTAALMRLQLAYQPSQADLRARAARHNVAAN